MAPKQSTQKPAASSPPPSRLLRSSAVKEPSLTDPNNECSVTIGSNGLPRTVFRAQLRNIFGPDAADDSVKVHLRLASDAAQSGYLTRSVAAAKRPPHTADSDRSDVFTAEAIKDERNGNYLVSWAPCLLPSKYVDTARKLARQGPRGHWWPYAAAKTIGRVWKVKWPDSWEPEWNLRNSELVREWKLRGQLVKKSL